MSKIKGTISLEKANVTPIEHLVGKPFSFGVFKSKSNPAYFLASSEGEMKTWMKVLLEVVSHFNPDPFSLNFFLKIIALRKPFESNTQNLFNPIPTQSNQNQNQNKTNPNPNPSNSLKVKTKE